MVRAPSIKSLMTELRLSRAQAQQVRQAIKTRGVDALREMAEGYPRTAHWIRRCYNMPRANDIRAVLLSEITECHGVQYVKHKDASFNDEPLATYCNAGDTYAATLVYYRGRWQISTMGDVVERHMEEVE